MRYVVASRSMLHFKNQWENWQCYMVVICKAKPVQYITLQYGYFHGHGWVAFRTTSPFPAFPTLVVFILSSFLSCYVMNRHLLNFLYIYCICYHSVSHINKWEMPSCKHFGKLNKDVEELINVGMDIDYHLQHNERVSSLLTAHQHYKCHSVHSQ